MDPRAEWESNRRLRVLARVTLAWALVIALRLGYLQLYLHDEFERAAWQQQTQEKEVRALRGAILDRNGEKLAMSIPVHTVAINPMAVPDLEMAAELISRTLEVDRDVLLLKMRLARSSDRQFLPVKRKVGLAEVDRLRAMGLEYIDIREETARSYPKGPLGAHLIGSVDHEERGNAGLELALEDELEGHPGSVTEMVDVKRRRFDSWEETKPLPGKDVTLTIDERLQFIAEREIAKAAEAHGCSSGTLTVLHVPSGDILAMANYPGFDPNQPPAQGESLLKRLNLAVAAPFEPGSVFKVITLAAALETTALTPKSVVACGNGRLTLAGRTIHDHHSYASLTMEDVLAKSSNIGAIQIGMKVGNERLHEYIRRFGVGKATGIPLPAESPGKLHAVRSWTRSSIGSVAMGHELSTTSLQLAQACMVIANNGLLVKPRLVMKLVRPGEPDEVPPQEQPVRVLRAETAMLMRRMMERVVLPGGTGTKAKLSGWSCGGKTGTAQRPDPKTGKYTKTYNSSFMGFAPVNNPAIVVVVTLIGSSEYGGTIAAPVFREVATSALRMLGVPKDILEQLPEADLVNTKHEGQDDAENDVALAELSEPAAAESTAAEGLALAGTGMAASRPVTGPAVPNFRGKTMRAVLEECAAMGLAVEIRGSGIARAQNPAPGTIVALGQRISVMFAR
jgi:cell division protein FtsI (penicillin-binding protein 3)